ncbi:hypothetical protein M422DRAFT_258112 [Sphaerobolus stellatus SS14]|uniref:Unplaced genomic scaffold SPHSTscaffold_79, whole genome shotgun sequence n=1 Tax=Sphaerobolus stellatus (strain SS14) TaxID=990650 RepID=A0A0C9U871_SPHS4|nr:hypothetical protein M422DRAFT_258112 [Sphaerobolus stellatus SS14]
MSIVPTFNFKVKAFSHVHKITDMVITSLRAGSSLTMMLLHRYASPPDHQYSRSSGIFIIPHHPSTSRIYNQLTIRDLWQFGRVVTSEIAHLGFVVCVISHKVEIPSSNNRSRRICKCC